MDLASITSLATSISLDWIFLVGLGIVSFADSLRAGTSRTVALSLAFPLTFILVGWVGKTQLLDGIAKQFSGDLAQGLFAGLVFLLCFLMFYRMMDTYSEWGGLQAAAGAAGLIIMCGVFWHLIPQFNALHTPAQQIQNVFGEAYRLWWLLVALVGLAAARA